MKTTRTTKLTPANARNAAGGLAYKLSPKHALAQIAATGCLGNTFYAQGDAQVATLCALAEQVDDSDFLAKLAIYARQKAYMKDMPVALLLLLSKRNPALFRKVFARVVDNGRTLRTLFQMIRGGQYGRKSLSYALQRAFQDWLNTAGVGALLSASIGSDPSLRDVFRLARPTPVNNERRALFGWLTDRPAEKWAPATTADLAAEVRDLVAFRAATTAQEQVDILARARFRWDLLADAVRGPEVWKALAGQMGPQALRMNLNTLQRHGVFDDGEMVEYVAVRLTDPDEIARARQFPYQYLAAYLNCDDTVPRRVRDALNVAAEHACGNVPTLPGPIVVGVDVSGSMGAPVTGYGRGQTTKMRCVDVAALFAAAIVRRNPESVIIPFDHQAHSVANVEKMPILALAERLARFGGGGTNCSLPLAQANTEFRHRRFAGVVLVSDNESWIGPGRYNSTPVMTEWQRFVANQVHLKHEATWPGPMLICIDLQPSTTAQAPDRSDILNVGGFSDAVFNVVASFLGGNAEHFVQEVEAIEV
jgi:60 kDa SS-A/Ro ribonucleoprotein